MNDIMKRISDAIWNIRHALTDVHSISEEKVKLAENIPSAIISLGWKVDTALQSRSFYIQNDKFDIVEYYEYIISASDTVVDIPEGQLYNYNYLKDKTSTIFLPIRPIASNATKCFYNFSNLLSIGPIRDDNILEIDLSSSLNCNQMFYKCSSLWHNVVMKGNYVVRNTCDTFITDSGITHLHFDGVIFKDLYKAALGHKSLISFTGINMKYANKCNYMFRQNECLKHIAFSPDSYIKFYTSGVSEYGNINGYNLPTGIFSIPSLDADSVLSIYLQSYDYSTEPFIPSSEGNMKTLLNHGLSTNLKNKLQTAIEDEDNSEHEIVMDRLFQLGISTYTQFCNMITNRGWEDFL